MEWIELARSGLGHFGWVQEARLPQGFLRREQIGKVEFFTPECKRVEGYAKLLELLLQEGYGFKVKIISKLRFGVQSDLAGDRTSGTASELESARSGEEEGFEGEAQSANDLRILIGNFNK